MKIAAWIFSSVLAFGATFPNELRRNDRFWLEAANDSMNGQGGVAQVNNIQCKRNIRISGSGMGERHTKSCIIHFESLSSRGGYSDIKACSTEVDVTACKYCRQAPVFSSSPADCISTDDYVPEAVPFGRNEADHHPISFHFGFNTNNRIKMIS